MEDFDIKPVEDSEYAMDAVLSILPLAHFQVLENPADKAGSGGKSLVDKVLEASSVLKNELLNSFSHVLF